MRVILFVLTCTTFVALGSSRQCYVCNSFKVKGNNCTDPFHKETWLIDTCSDPGAVCLKEKLRPIEGVRDYVYRMCAVSDYCQTTGKNSRHCSTCDSDLCNASVIVRPSYLLLVVPLIKRYIL